MTSLESTSPVLSLPADVAAVIRGFYTCEFTTVNRSGQPMTWPAVAYFDEPGGRIVCTVSIAFPVKAHNARHHPGVSLLFSDPTGSGLVDPPAVLVQGDADVAEVLEYTPDIIGLFRTVSRRQPDSSRFAANPIARRMFSWYLYQRIALRVTPRRILVWPHGASDQPPTLIEATHGG